MSTGKRKETREKGADVRSSNIIAAKGVAASVRTSLGPKGMDKMIVSASADVTITNDGATILDKMKVQHPAAKMLVDLSKAQDIETGDGTTTVVILCGAFLGAVEKLLTKGIHPTTIAESFQTTGFYAQKLLREMAIPLELTDKETIIKSAKTSLNSKMVSQSSHKLAPIAVNAVLSVINPEKTNADLRDIRVVKKLGGTMDDLELIDGLLLTQHIVGNAGGPSIVEKAKIALIQFQLSPPKSNMDSSVVISDYQQMDRVLAAQKKYIFQLCKKIKKSGCNVLLIQKSILRDAVNAQALHFLAQMKIMTIKDIERSEVEFISKTLGLVPVASIEAMSASKMAEAAVVEQRTLGESKVVQITGIKSPTRKTVSVLVRGSNELVLDESERSLHDALCVVRSLVKEKFLLPGGGAPETELAVRLAEYAKTLGGKESYCVREFSQALEIIPYTLAENAGLNPVSVVTQLRSAHKAGKTTSGINVRKGEVTDILEENVLQPLLVTASALKLSIETVIMLLKIDDVLDTR